MFLFSFHATQSKLLVLHLIIWAVHMGDLLYSWWMELTPSIIVVYYIIWIYREKEQRYHIFAGT